jgi:hypothetical protein
MSLLHGLQNLSLNVGGKFMAMLKIFERKYLRKVFEFIGEELKLMFKYWPTITYTIDTFRLILF